MAKNARRSERLLQAAKEALAIAKGELEPVARIEHAPSDVNVRLIRERLGLTQSEFAGRYQFSIARIRDWEQGRSRPDAAMRAYLMNIAASDAAARQSDKRAKGIRRVGLSAQLIADWSNTREAQGLLPVVLRRLISRTASVTTIVMSGRDSISMTGWDGIVDASKATPWVPEGRSFWELGTGGRPKDKAELDYLKRTKSTPDEIRAVGTFVFVSSRIWREKERWAEHKRLVGDWKDVRAYDAIDLEQWLELSPATSIWLGEQLGMSGSGLVSVEEAWRIWSEQTNPPLTTGTMLANRAETEKRILQSVAGNQTTIAVRADSVEEAVAFACACFLREEQSSLAARTVVVTQEEGWRFVDANSEIDIVIVARPELARERAPNEAIKVILPFAISDRGAFYRGRAASAADDGSITVDRLRPLEFEAALADIGIDRADAQRLSRLTSRSWTVFRRLRAKNDSIAKPLWSEHAASRVLSTVCLIGSWAGERAGDRAVVERIAGRPYDDVERELRVLATMDDAPVMAIGSVWRAKSPLELLHLVGERITREELDRFFATATTLLASPDPMFELPGKDRWQAELYKKGRDESGLVLDSICDSLIKLAVLGPDVDNLAIHAIATRVGALVRDLLNGADSERWLSLYRVLSELAEAAPTEFLNAVEKSLLEREPAVARLIQETGHSGILGGRCWHADLLRALEILAWRPQDLPRVIEILVKLTKFPVEGNWMNTPANTLLSLFRSWLPQTSTSLEKRINLLDRVVLLNPDVGWKLLAGIALRWSDTATPNARPKWRDDDAGAGYGVTRAEMYSMLKAAGARLVALAEGDATRLIELIKSLDQFDDQGRTEIFEMTSQYANEGRSDDDRALIRETLREYIVRCKKYGGRAPDQFAKDEATLEALHRKLEPHDLLARYAWLFNKSWLDVREEDDENFEDSARRVQQMRIGALREMQAAGGIETIERFIDQVRQPSAVGIALSGVFVNPQGAADWISAHKAQLKLDAPIGKAITGLLTYSVHEYRSTVIANVTDIALVSWSSADLTDFYLMCPSDRTTWQQLERTDQSIQTSYWSKVAPQVWGTAPDDLNEFVRRLLAAKRPRAAFVATEAFSEKLDPQLLYQMLDGMLRIAEEGSHSSDEWHLARAFNILERAGILDEQKLASLEFAYVPALQFSDRGLKALGRWIAKKPEVFVELLVAVYKAEHAPEPPEPTDQERNTALNAWTVLHQFNQIPGQKDDGSVDGEQLSAWVVEARRLCREVDRQGSGDGAIGRMLSVAGTGSDGIWPIEGVRDVLDGEDAEEIRSGFYIGALNERGVTSRTYDEGGLQERELAKKFQKYAVALSQTHPRLAETIGMIQKNYEDQARREDLDAKLRIEGV